jgi:hypothetical protein
MKVAFAQMCNDDIGFGLLLLIFSPQRRPFPEVEVIKLNSAKIYRFLQLLSHSRGFFARV